MISKRKKKLTAVGFLKQCELFVQLSGENVLFRRLLGMVNILETNEHSTTDSVPLLSN